MARLNELTREDASRVVNSLVTWPRHEPFTELSHSSSIKRSRRFTSSACRLTPPLHTPATEALKRNVEQRKHACSNQRDADQGTPLRAAGHEPWADVARDQPDGGPVRAAAVRPACDAGVCGAGRGQVSGSVALRCAAQEVGKAVLIDVRFTQVYDSCVNAE